MSVLRLMAAAWVAMLAALVSVGPVRADCLDFDDPAVAVVHGAIRGVRGAGDVAYRIGHSASGFGHVQGAVEVEWTQGGDVRRQRLFHGMHDRPPAALMRTDRGLEVRLQYCPGGNRACRARTARYVYEPAQHRFRGADAVARAFIAEACE